MRPESPPDEDSPPGMEQPPLPRVVYAVQEPHTAGSEHALVPLARDDQDGRGKEAFTVEVALVFERALEPARVAVSLGKALALFPECAGRFVKSEIAPSVAPNREIRTCILCNNAGIPFASLKSEEEMPSITPPVPPHLFDVASGAWPEDGGGPLMRVRLVTFAGGGQMLLLSYVRGLADFGALTRLLRAWAGLYSGIEPDAAASSSDLDRLAVERKTSDPFTTPAFNLHFTYLHRSAGAPAAYEPLFEPAVFSLPLERGPLEEQAARLTEAARRRRLIFDTESFTASHAAFVTVLRALNAEEDFPVSLVVDYRDVFGICRHFGSTSAFVDLELPRDLVEAVSLILKRPQAAALPEFWAWKARQPPQEFTAKLVLSSWADMLGTEDISFSEAEPLAVSVGEGCWQRWAAVYAKRGCSFALVLPRAGGLLLQALLPKDAADYLRRENAVGHAWRPRV